VTLVLKKSGTIVTDGKNVFKNTTGNPGMASGGSGDVLTGMIAAFISQTKSNFDAAKAAVYIHGLAGDISAKEKTMVSMIPSDIIENIPAALIKIGIK
ncbi:MAG: ADP/ATP-dependent (S)-NAD(P)H-hydrate dehydratase, partial [Elusimicrobiota bacterium]